MCRAFFRRFIPSHTTAQTGKLLVEPQRLAVVLHMPVCSMHGPHYCKYSACGLTCHELNNSDLVFVTVLLPPDTGV